MEEMRCPVTGKGYNGEKSKDGTTNKDWWPNKLNLRILHQNSSKGNPMDKEFDYKKEFEKLDLDKIKADLYALMTDSKDWWPADYGHYGPFFIRMAWHSAGTYRSSDGRGGACDGTQRFAPLNSWPDNVNLDKARRLLWPIKKKYGRKISWADLMILAGNCALESMGMKTFGFGGGREDVWEPQEDVYWGGEKEWLEDNRYSGDRDLENPLAAVQMGLIYVNPEGPNGVPDAVGSGRDVRDTFRRMGMNDMETVALIAGGHTFGKCHGAGPATFVGPEPEAAPLEEQGLGWKNSYKSGKGEDAIGSGLEGAWKPNPIKWDMGYLETLFKYDWNLVKSPAGAYQWVPADPAAAELVEDAHNPAKKHPPMMTTADLSLRMDPIFAPIAKQFLLNPEEFEKEFAKAWFKLTHRDMGPIDRYLGKEVPDEKLIWQDPLPTSSYRHLEEAQIEMIKQKIVDSGLTIAQLISTAWASASTFRNSDKRGGGNGGRIRLLPQRDWEVNQPDRLKEIIEIYEKIQSEIKIISFADLVILGGCVGIEQAASKNGYHILVPFSQGRVDATQEEMDIKSFGVLEPKADGFRNYFNWKNCSQEENMLIDKAQLLDLTAPEMTVLLGGLRVLGMNYNATPHGVFTKRTGVLSNDFFTNLLNIEIEWSPMSEESNLFIGKNRETKEVVFTATRTDLVFGSNAELRAIAEVYGADDGEEKFVQDFVSAWVKVMDADRFDIRKKN